MEVIYVPGMRQRCERELPRLAPMVYAGGACVREGAAPDKSGSDAAAKFLAWHNGP